MFQNLEPDDHIFVHEAHLIATADFLFKRMVINVFHWQVSLCCVFDIVSIFRTILVF